MTDVAWLRPHRCESHACPEWQVDGDLVRLRSSDRPDAVAVLTVDELAALVAAWQNGETVVNDG